MNIESNRSTGFGDDFRRALLVSLLIFGAAGISSTLAAQTMQSKPYLSTSGDSGLDRICAGDSVIFRVTAQPQQKEGVTVSGSVLNKSYGTLRRATSKTSAVATPAGSAPFTFVSIRPGNTTLTFTAGRSYASAAREVKIVSCGSMAGGGQAGPAGPKDRKTESRDSKPGALSPFNVTSISTWSVGMVITATIDNARMSADGQGHFTGLSDVEWKTSVIGGPGCGAAEYPISPSKAELSGDLDGSNQLVMKITFQPKEFAGFATCGRSISTSNVGAPDPLIITVAATGGSSTQPHAVTAKNGSFVGSATTVVSRERR
jgi:hypothetical protein